MPLMGCSKSAPLRCPKCHKLVTQADEDLTLSLKSNGTINELGPEIDCGFITALVAYFDGVPRGLGMFVPPRAS